MKPTPSTGHYQTEPTALRLYIESAGKDPCNPDCDVLDLLTLQVISDAADNNVKSPLTLKFFDSDQVFIGKRQIDIKSNSVYLETIFQSCGFVRVPLRS